MNKKYFFLLSLVLLTAAHSMCQPLFTYGTYTADAGDFLRAYKKNNPVPPKDKAASMREYLDLYIQSKLKVQEAYERKMDTLPYLKTELENLRTQISETYMADPEAAARMTAEAFQRGLKDIEAAHIFISIRNAAGFIDSAAAFIKKDEVLQRLLKGEEFLQVARQLSDEPDAAVHSGKLGFITVFTLPYEFENALYQASPGGISSFVRSRNGFHIFKNISERKAAGRIRLQQILLAIPPGSDEDMKKQIAARADSLYKRIMAGDNFNRLASDFSNDYISAATGGMLPEMGVGQYDPVFEKAAWDLPKDGAVGKPFLTQHGWHILKRISRKPAGTDANDQLYLEKLKEKIMTDGRWKNSRDFIYKKVIEKKGFKIFEYRDEALWNMSDSVLDGKPMTSGWDIKAHTPLFAIGDSVYHANHWINYANAYRFKQDGSGPKPWEQVREEWIGFSLMEYYRTHLEEFNEDFRQQMNEFRDGNLFFEIMQQEVWNKAQTDTVALRELYAMNMKNYLWKKSADAVLFFCADMNTANDLYAKINKDNASWKKLAAQYSEKVIADSARFEWEQIPNLFKAIPQNGLLTTPLLNNNDNTASFAYVLTVYHQPSQRNFNDARGMLINDYQALLEKRWNEELRKKYPVRINEKVLAELSR